MLALFFVSLPALAQTSPCDYYRQLAGEWTAEESSGTLQITYSVGPNRVSMHGETCAGPASGDGNEPRSCGLIDQDYSWRDESFERDFPQFGSQPVQILEFTPNKI